MDYERFKNNPSGSLLKTTGPEGDYWAFVPNPLPPDLSIDIELSNKLADSALALGTLRSPGTAVITPSLRLILLHIEAHRSSEIEGTLSTLPEIFAYQARQLPLPIPGIDRETRARVAKEVTNYISATEYGFERLNELPVSKRMIQELHERLLEGVRGEERTPGNFRRVQNAIGSPGDSFKDARYIPPPVPQMNECLNNLELFMNSDNTIHPLIRLALIHYQFEAIHPFLDGNGRIGRLILPLLLNQWGLLDNPLLYMSVYFQKLREQYNHLLFEVSASSAWRDWILFFLEGIIQQSEETLRIMREIQQLQTKWRDQLEGTRTQNIFRLIDLLFQKPIISIPEVRNFLAPISATTARKLVLRLVDEGILELFGSEGKTKDYWSSDIFRILRGTV